MMQTMKLVLVFGLLAATTATAAAQPGSAQPPQGGGGFAAPPATYPGGFHPRGGRILFGGSLGLGAMSLNGEDVQCTNCDYSTASFAAAGHIGGFVGPRLALMAEGQVNGQTIASDTFSGDTSVLTHAALMFAAQYWLTPQLWIKGGIGLSNLRVERSYYGDGIIDEVAEVPENGLALLGAVGYELFSAPHFSIDLQGRLINGSYDRTDNNVSAASIGIGINWY